MKFKSDFVTNSSSTSFIITNTSSVKKSLVDFMKENPQLLDDFLDTYDWHKGDERYTQQNVLLSAAVNNEYWEPGESRSCIFGDEDGTLIGAILDYMLREGGSSKSFTWCFEEYHR